MDISDEINDVTIAIDETTISEMKAINFDNVRLDDDGKEICQNVCCKCQLLIQGFCFASVKPVTLFIFPFPLSWSQLLEFATSVTTQNFQS